ncbi:MAG: hypothetical protein ACRD8U_08235 [Pyrinomonadaceae bacterium]
MADLRKEVVDGCTVARFHGLEVFYLITGGLRPRLYAAACYRRLKLS